MEEDVRNVAVRSVAAVGMLARLNPCLPTRRGHPRLVFLAFCADENILKVTGIKAHLGSYRSASRRPERRLQTSTSEGVQAHQVRSYVDSLLGQENPPAGVAGEDAGRKPANIRFKHVRDRTSVFNREFIAGLRQRAVLAGLKYWRPHASLRSLRAHLSRKST